MKENKNGLERRDVIRSSAVLVVNMVVIFLIILLSLFLVNGRDTFRYMSENVRETVILAGSDVILSLVMYFYFFFEDRRMLRSVARFSELLIILYLALLFSVFMGRYVSINARPFAFFALTAALIFGKRDASFINIIFAFLVLVIDEYTGIVALTATEHVANLLLIFCAGMLGVFLSDRLKTRGQCAVTGVVLLIPAWVVIALLEVTMVDFSVSGAAWAVCELLLYGALGSFLSAMLFMFLLPLFEACFSNLTVFRLRELTSDDAPLIRELKEKAKGSYMHSVTVAQLAQAAAVAIGENGELARAAAYYHDVGKMKNPEMFTENQTGRNIHDELAPEVSADIIRAHARDGAEMIRERHLPEFFADVALQHHGTMPIKYFYAKALRMSEQDIDMENYCYYGPTPDTKIAAVIMIADSAEAAVRSMQDRSPEKMEKVIRELIEERLNMDQFDRCDITMNDLFVIKDALVEQLSGVYHKRIEYPKLKVRKQ